jgi:competence protein ComEA
MMKSFVRSLALAIALGPLAAMAMDPVDINSADTLQLEKINGIGPAKAQAIVDYRTKNGPFQKVEDLEKVAGIGPKMLEKMKPDITVKAAPAATRK